MAALTRRRLERLAARLEGELRGAGSAERAVNEKRYLKSDLEHFGVPVPMVRKLARRAVRGLGLDRGAVLALSEILWVCSPWRKSDRAQSGSFPPAQRSRASRYHQYPCNSAPRSDEKSLALDRGARAARPIHERRLAAVEILVHRAGLLEAGDLGWIETLIRGAKTWALVDSLAIKVAGSLVERFPELGRDLDRWASDGDFWVRRSALLALLVPLRRGDGDLERFARYADGMLEEREFFVRKAIGWVLREISKQRPDWVAAWLAPRAARVSGVTLREAVKYLPAGERQALTAAPRLTSIAGR